MSEEIWKNIDKHENYEVSNYGKVRNVLSKKERKQHNNGKGYLKVNLNGKSLYVHRIVAIAFLSNPELKRTVNHIDCDKSNNNLKNLEWATHKENISHAWDNGLHKKTMEFAKRGKIVIDLSTGIFYDTIEEAAFARCLNSSTLSYYIRGDRKNKTTLVSI